MVRGGSWEVPHGIVRGACEWWRSGRVSYPGRSVLRALDHRVHPWPSQQVGDIRAQPFARVVGPRLDWCAGVVAHPPGPTAADDPRLPRSSGTASGCDTALGAAHHLIEVDGSKLSALTAGRASSPA